MKRALIFLGLLSVVSAAAFAQSQRTSRTNSRPHDRSTTISGDTVKDAHATPADKAPPDQDMDKTNPPKDKKDKPPANSGSKQEGQEKKQ